MGVWNRARYRWEYGDSGELWCRTDEVGVKVDLRPPWGLNLCTLLVYCGDGQDWRMRSSPQCLEMTMWSEGRRKPREEEEHLEEVKERMENLVGVPCHQFRAIGSVMKTHAVCCHSWESPSAAVSLLPGNTAVSLKTPSLEPVHDQSCHRDNKTVIRSQRGDVLQSATIMVSYNCKVWSSSTGTDHAKEYNWHRGNQQSTS